jgi:beta-glucosidase
VISGTDDSFEFPNGFVWGVATAAHQIEGQDTNNDWWAFEHNPSKGCAESSGDACDSYHRWPEDLDLIAQMGLGAYRFSLEWSRIEPAEGEFSQAALDHYRRMCGGCHERGISPMVTFQHFTIPRWLAAQGGWEAEVAPERLGRFVEKAARHLGDLITWACTINEPSAAGAMGYLMGEYPPGVKGDLDRHLAVNEAMVKAHRLAVEALKSGPGSFPVGITLSMAENVADPGGEAMRDMAEDFLEDVFLRATAGDDYVGVQAYTRMHFGPDGLAPNDPSVPETQMRTENWPQSVEHCVRRAAAASGLPIYVTESGLATEDDSERIEYLDEALRGLGRCLADGVDVRGYFVWSLLDNFEWNEGYRPKLGLYEVDRVSFERRAKPSAAWYSQVARLNSLGSVAGSGG